MLEKQNVSGFIDVEDLEGGFWDVQLMDNIEISPNFILILSNGTLDRCKGDWNYTDFLHKVTFCQIITRHGTFMYL